LDTAGKTEEKITFFFKRVAARLSPINSLGDPLGARVALLEVVGGVRKRAFSSSFVLGFLSFSFLSLGGNIQGEGWGRRGFQDGGSGGGHAFAFLTVSQTILVREKMTNHVFHVSLHCAVSP
jgi:hypothetical protein